MKKLKLVVISIFLLTLAFFEFSSDSNLVSGQTTLSAPTGVIASDSAYSTKVGLLWDTIRNAKTYRIFRNTVNDSATATDIGTTPANTFFDTTAPQGQTLFYWVRAENPTTVSPLSQAEQGTRANGGVGGGIQPLLPPDAPPANPVTATKAYLGKALFWDEQLSSTRTVSCGTCHSGAGGGVDKRTATQRTRSTNPGLDGIFSTPDDVFGSPGVMSNNLNGAYNWSSTYGLREQVTGRRAMPYTDSGYPGLLFWDGRANQVFRDPLTNQVVLQGGGALENQILGPPLSDTEMAHSGRNWQDVVNRLNNAKPLALASNIPNGLKNWIDGRTYPELFEETFGTPEITPVRIALAIATHERTLYSDQTPFDQLNQGINTFTAAEQRGLNLFTSGVTGCTACHAGNLQSDGGFHYIGVRPTNEDTGRQQVTNNINNAGQFRTPILRNVELRGAYFHNGRFTTLREVVDFYNRGGDFNAPNKDPNIRPRGLGNNQLNDIVAFLSRPLTDPRVRNELPPFDRPQLYTESDRVPVIVGTGIAGSNGLVPTAIAIEPPLAGNPAFTVGLSGALGGANAVLVINETDPGATANIPASGSFARVNVSLQGNGAGNGFGSATLQIPDNAAIIGKTFFGRWYVTDAGAANGVAVSQAFRFTVFGEATAPNRAKHADFDGDGKTDVSVFRPADGNWYILRSSDNSFSATNFGLASDVITPADFDGDGKTDVGVFRNGAWYIQRSRDGLQVINFGSAGDKPQPADYDGDGIADAAVFRASTGTWYIQQSRDGFKAVTFGNATDRPVAADYDGDGKADVAVYRDGNWYIQRSSAGFTAVSFGLAEDKPVFGDYDGDGKADIAVYRPGSGGWYFLRSGDGSFGAVSFGLSTDVPSPGDYDGDGKNDTAVFRAGNWYLMQSSNNAFRAQSWGTSQDIAVPSAIVP
ncbi:MAG: FG-GAP-like repeat-containing protein [Pyrinomonadaceae bacterium]|nr:FG-GAP-like repeat-containing protein [Pyrinomonadaceae bacterium]